MTELEYSRPGKSGDITRIKARVAGLLVSCPVTQDNPPDCPLRAVRRLPLRARYRWLDDLPPGRMKQLLEQHGECIVRKERENHEPA